MSVASMSCDYNCTTAFVPYSLFDTFYLEEKGWLVSWNANKVCWLSINKTRHFVTLGLLAANLYTLVLFYELYFTLFRNIFFKSPKELRELEVNLRAELFLIADNQQ